MYTYVYTITLGPGGLDYIIIMVIPVFMHATLLAYEHSMKKMLPIFFSPKIFQKVCTKAIAERAGLVHV